MDAAHETLVVGADGKDKGSSRKIAILRRSGDMPGLFWMGGFKSEMTGSKATALDKLGEKLGLGVTRFDYSGHGASSGEFTDGTISSWLEDALAAFASTVGPQIVIGSSMGGWLALLLNKALRADTGEGRVRGLVLIAPAVDMTEDLMRARFTPEEIHALHMNGRVEQPSEYSDEPYVLTEELIKDGAKHLLFGKGSIVTGCPVVILQGGKDKDVPPEHAMNLLAHLTLDPVTFTLIPDGDHSLSRDADLAKLNDVVTRLVKGLD